MNARAVSGFWFLSILALVLFTGYSALATGTTTCSVYFGTPQENGGVCVGRGLCGDPVAGGISVTFKVSDNNPDVLIMMFSLSELKQKQPDQVAYFADNSGSYNFDLAYSLSGSAFAPLNLPSNSQIIPSSNSVVEINGDIVTDYITYSHDQ